MAHLTTNKQSALLVSNRNRMLLRKQLTQPCSLTNEKNVTIELRTHQDTELKIIRQHRRYLGPR